jgi:glucan phosphoethanolaminetransferase (alkaline phosphatase superfamily)
VHYSSQSGIAGGLLGLVILQSLSFLILLFPFTVLPARFSLTVLLPFWSLLPWEWWHVMQTSSFSTLGALSAVRYSNVAETKEFLSGNWIFFVLSLLLPLVVLLFAWKPLVALPRPHIRWSLLVCAGLIAIVFALSLREYRLAPASPFQVVFSAMDRQIERTYPLGLLKRMVTVELVHRQVAAWDQQLRGQYIDAVRDPAAPKNAIVVLVIGESSRRDHWQLFGYARPTTPKLAKRAHLVTLDSVYAPACLTAQTIPMLLTGSFPDQYDSLQSQVSLFRIFHTLGFQTAWISNQPADDSPLLDVHVRQADTLIRISTSYMQDSHYDMSLLAPINSMIQKTPGSCFLVVQLMGQHYRYDLRYPEAFDQFEPSMKKQGGARFGNLQDSALFVNSYDNAILYNDAVLDSVLRLLEQTGRPVQFLFVSDHAESLFDLPDQILGHGVTANFSSQLEIPAFWWSSSMDSMTGVKAVRNKRMSAPELFEHILDETHVTLRSPPKRKPTRALVLTPSQEVRNYPVE